MENLAGIFGLVPCGFGTMPCDICEIFNLADNIIRFLVFTLALPILVLAILIGGFIWMTSAGNPERIKKGRNILTSSIVGIFIAFGGWLIVDTIIKTFANEGAFTAPWNSIRICPAPIVSESPIVKPPIPRTPPVGTFQTEAEARAYFAKAGIEINKNPCMSTQTANCTDLNGLPVSAAEKLAALAQGGKFCVSGGTEGEGTIHKTHGIGKPIVDLKPSCAGSIEISALTALRNRVGVLAKEAICESQDGVLRSSNSSCLTSSRGTPFTQAQLKQLNHIHVIFPQ